MRTCILIGFAVLGCSIPLIIIIDLVRAYFADEECGPERDSRSLGPPAAPPQPADRWWQCSWCGQYFSTDHKPKVSCPCKCDSHGICAECASRVEKDEHLPAGALTQSVIVNPQSAIEG